MTTATELLTETLPDNPTKHLCVADIMTTRVVTIEMDDRLTLAKEIFDNVSFHHLLVVDNEQLSGILSHRDFHGRSVLISVPRLN